MILSSKSQPLARIHVLYNSDLSSAKERVFLIFFSESLINKPIRRLSSCYEGVISAEKPLKNKERGFFEEKNVKYFATPKKMCTFAAENVN